MYRKFFEEEMAKKTVFKDESKLSPDFVPEELVHRDEEFRKLVQFFKPVLENSASQRVLITGPVGVGKTALASRFGQELEGVAKERGLNLINAHINCRKQGTPQMVLHKLARNFPLSVPRRGFSSQELMEQIVDYLEKKDALLMIALDELDYFINKNGPDLLYSLTRVAEESGSKNRISLIAISHTPNFLDLIDEATRSSFMHNQVELGKYSSDQIKDILNQRIDLAFKPGYVTSETVKLISDISSRRGDARFALELLWCAGRVASRGEPEEVSPNHVRRAKSEIHPEIRKDVLFDLKDHELLCLLALSRKLKISSKAYVLTGEVEEAYQIVCEEYEEEPRGHTQFWKYIDRMKSLGLIDSEITGEGQVGKSQKISISDASPEVVEEEVEKILENK